MPWSGIEAVHYKRTEDAQVHDPRLRHQHRDLHVEQLLQAGEWRG